MGRTTVRKRVTPRPRVRTVHTIEDAREEILKLVPAGHNIHLSAFFHDNDIVGRRYSSESYNCSVYCDAREVIDIDASSPAKLVKAFVDWMNTPYVEPTPPRRAPTAHATLSKSLTVVGTRPNESRSSAPLIGHLVPRLPYQRPLLTNGGDS